MLRVHDLLVTPVAWLYVGCVQTAQSGGAWGGLACWRVTCGVQWGAVVTRFLCTAILAAAVAGLCLDSFVKLFSAVSVPGLTYVLHNLSTA